MKTMLAMLCAIAAADVSAQALEFKGVPFGATMDQLRSAHPGFNCLGPTDCTFSKSTSGSLTYAGRVVDHARASFSQGQLTGIDVQIDPSFYLMTKGAIEAKYGAPTATAAEDYRTQGGLVTTNNIATWNLADGGLIRVTKFGSSITAGSVRIRSRVGLQAEADAFKAHTELAKKDI